ncbi:WESB_1763 family membrane protein [uncultured Brachyspira sp.]|uniref:WESB_1763 family membrane protein n=1 Tax=uncultured Brachyspira sp. TaxID=221953 RepID=UPI00259907AC|nr:WESB_1763 family membrane protein [uncultured Brachyspira sp.]
MFYILKNKIANNNSFIKAYHFWTNALIIAVIINFLFFRTLFLNIEENSFFYLINYIIEYGIFLAFFLLLFYKFYNYLFNSQILDGILGIIFLIFGVLKLYISDINIYNITELLFFIFTFLITIKTLLPLILLKNINELQRGAYIFILISLGFSNLNYIILSANKIIDNDIMHYISLYLIEYMGKVSSISFIIIMIGYIIIFAKRMIKKNIYKYFIFILVFTIVFILKSKYSNYLIIIFFYNALGIGLSFPFILYVGIIFMFLIILFGYLTDSIISKKYSAEFLVFTLFILAGLDMSGFTLRLMSIFSIIEMLEMVELIEIKERDNLTL